jgi:hypothetical protein
MKTYGSGKAGQYPKQEADKLYDRMQIRMLTVVGVAAFFAGACVGYYAFPFIFRHVSWAQRVPVAAYWIGFSAFGVTSVAATYYLACGIHGPLDRLARERVRHLRGGQTEALVAYSLRSFNDKWHLFNGIAMKGGGDIDHVLVGPGGLYCLSTKSAKGIYTREQDGRVLLNGKPTDDVAEAQRLAMTLRNWLEARLQSDHGVKSIPFVRPVLVVPFAFIDFPYSTMNVWVVDEYKFFDVADTAKATLSATTVEGCVKILKELTGWDERPAQIEGDKAVQAVK